MEPASRRVGGRTREQLRNQSLTASNLLWLTALLCPVLSTIGWAFDIPLMTSGLPSLPAMETNTAVGLVLASIAVYFSRSDGGRVRWWRWFGPVAASLVLIFGALILVEYVFGWETSADRIVEQVAARALHVPNRVPPQTAFNFVLLGIALLAFNFEAVSFGQVAALAAAVNGIAAATAYIFSTESFFGFPTYAQAPGMAVLAALTFILLVGALLCGHPDGGMMTLVTSDTHAGEMARKILVAGIVAPPVIGVLTKVGVVADWYDVTTQISLFALVMVGLILYATWRAASRSEHEELLARGAFEALQKAHVDLKQASETRQIFSALIENSSDFIGIADPNGRALYVNPAGRRMVGLPATVSIRDTNIEDYHPPDQRSFVNDVILTTVIDRGHWEGETALRHWETGHTIPVSHTGFLISAPETGQILGMGTIIRDITEQKRLEREQQFIGDVASELAQTLGYEETLDTIARLGVRYLGDLCLIDLIEERGTVRRVKVASAEPSQEWACHLLRQVRVDRSRPDPVWTVLQTKTPFLIERMSPEVVAASFAQDDDVMRMIGGVGPQSMLAVPLVARGKLVGSIALMSTNPSRLYGPWDVHLAEALAERAALSLESARLYRDAQQAITLREEVLAIVSHDLKNPLTTIAMVGQMLTRTLPDDRAKLAELANRIERSAGIMQKLISDLLDLSKIQGGALSIDAHPEKFREVSAPVIDVLSAQANAKGVRFEISIPSDLPDVLCDRSRVGQVLSNLLGNAIKFTPAGGLVRLSVHEGDDDVEVSVSDTGPGIKPDELPKLFEPFWQGAEARTLGAGLGLTIAHEIVVAHGGRIWAESELGAGSTFRFTLPTAHVSTPVRRL